MISTATNERIDPVAAADALIARFDLREPRDIRVELIAYELGAVVHWRDTGSADARVVRAGARARIAVDREARGTPRARFSIAHELAHHQLHHDYDAIARIHGEPRASGRAFLVETEANRFAAHLLVPTSMAAPMCSVAPPTLDAVARLARAFDVSLSVAAQRWAEMAPTPCAVVEVRAGRVKRAVRSRAFRGAAVQRREVEDAALARDVARGAAPGTRVHTRAWGGSEERAVIEECVPLDDDGAVLAWLWHSS